MNIREFYEQEWRKIAHDIRTPLAVLSLCHQQLEAHMQDTEKQEEYKELFDYRVIFDRKIRWKFCLLCLSD